jgi:hypothetical protein
MIPALARWLAGTRFGTLREADTTDWWCLMVVESSQCEWRVNRESNFEVNRAGEQPHAGGVRAMENRVSVVPGACEAWHTGFAWSRGRAKPGNQGFRGPGAVRGMENRVSVTRFRACPPSLPLPPHQSSREYCRTIVERLEHGSVPPGGLGPLVCERYTLATSVDLYPPSHARCSLIISPLPPELQPDGQGHPIGFAPAES